MKVTASTLLIGAAAAAVTPDQQVLRAPEAVQEAFKSATSKDAWSKPLSALSSELKHLTDDARAVWDEVAMLFPEEMSKASFFSSPKPHTKKSDWDFHTIGKEIQDVWVTNSHGDKEREIDGNLEAFNLRTKKVDPSSLGVDKVKQYSGYLDQPVNVGYSYSGGSVSNTVAAGKDVYALLTLFFKQFPEYAKQPFHISGESYAGHYIPVFASEILSHKKRNINLQSVLIGNGLTDGYTQYDYYRPMACGEGGWPAVLDSTECASMDNSLPRCKSLIENCYKSESVWSCVPASIYCNNAMIGPYQKSGRNPYDVRKDCSGNSLCYDELDWISEYLNRKDVMKALGAEVSSYDSCNFDINRNFLFQGDWMKPFHRLVPGILKEIPVLIYAGDADFICNWLGNLGWTNELEWSGQKGYQSAELKDFKLLDDGTKIGSVKSSGNFTFMRLHAGGHMVPYDQPVASLEMLNRWLAGEWVEA